MNSENRIRVLFLVPDLTVGGAERHVSTVAPLLDRGRFDVRVCCIKERGPLFSTVQSAGIEAVCLEGAERLKILQAAHRLRRYAGSFAPDVVITRGLNAEFLGGIGALVGRRATHVVWKHNCGGLPTTRREQAMERLSRRGVDWYFGVAFGQMEYLVDDLKIPGSKIRIVRNGVKLGRPRWEKLSPSASSLASEFGLREHESVVGIVGVLRPEKDHMTFLRAARIVADRSPNTRFLIVGDGEERMALEQATDDLALRDAVIFTGMRSDAEDILRLCDVSVLTSTTECCPTVLLESMAAGVPSVCTAVGGVPEMIDEDVTGFLVPPADPHGTAEGILDILGSPGRSEEMGRAARDRAERQFSLDVCVERTERALSRIVERARETFPRRVA